MSVIGVIIAADRGLGDSCKEMSKVGPGPVGRAVSIQQASSAAR